MAKQTTTTGTRLKKASKKRPNVHSKKTTSNLKTSKNYKKLNRGQG
jgi:hypothetical protein